MNTKSNLPRRNFLKSASLGVSLGALASTPAGSAAAEKSAARPRREAWIATLAMDNYEAKTTGELVGHVLERMKETLACHPDLICLPETFPYHRVAEEKSTAEQAESLDGPIVKRFADFARENHCWVICPLLTKEGGRIYNSAVVINRMGEVVGAYHKIHPTVDEIESGVMPGAVDPPVFQTDFGVLGIQICFDVNWPEGWRKLRKAGAEIIFWPSAFPGGRMLNAMAWINKTYIVTSTLPGPSRIIDITGDDMGTSGRFESWVCRPVNLEKAFIHIWPYLKEIDGLREKYGQAVRVTKMHQEDWAIIESVSPDVPLLDALREFNIPLHEEHIRRADEKQEKSRPA